MFLSQSNIGGIEPVAIDGRQYFFGFQHTEDRVMTPLFDSADSAAEYAAAHLAQRDGKHDKAFWLEQANESLHDPSITDPEGQSIALAPIKAAIADLKRDPSKIRSHPDFAIPTYLGYLLTMNCEWPDEPAPQEVEDAVVRLGMEIDDTSPWLDETSLMLSGEQAYPDGASPSDAALVFMWCWETLVAHQRHGWSRELGLA